MVITREHSAVINQIFVDNREFFIHNTPAFDSAVNYGRPLSVSGRPCYILPMFFIYFYGRLILRPWLTEVRESFTRGGP